MSADAAPSPSPSGIRPARRPRRTLDLVTPEGLALPFPLASRGTRFGALVLDLVFVHLAMLALVLVLVFALGGFAALDRADDTAEPLVVVLLIGLFAIRNFYFAFFEMGPRGATPGKRITGIRIAARDGGRLTSDAVIARNLLREIEVFIPAYMVLGADAMGGDWLNWLALGWVLLFAFLFFFNKDRMRGGDIIAGTVVVDAPRGSLAEILSSRAASGGISDMTGADYRFTEEELAIYGEYELQTLERVLRDNRDEAIVAVAQAIGRKIDRFAAPGDEVPFLEAYYAQLRRRLERGMTFGKRKVDKHADE